MLAPCSRSKPDPRLCPDSDCCSLLLRVMGILFVNQSYHNASLVPLGRQGAMICKIALPRARWAVWESFRSRIDTSRIADERSHTAICLWRLTGHALDLHAHHWRQPLRLVSASRLTRQFICADVEAQALRSPRRDIIIIDNELSHGRDPASKARLPDCEWKSLPSITNFSSPVFFSSFFPLSQKLRSIVPILLSNPAAPPIARTRVIDKHKAVEADVDVTDYALDIAWLRIPVRLKRSTVSGCEKPSVHSPTRFSGMSPIKRRVRGSIAGRR
jgi:hypothetical protein